MSQQTTSALLQRPSFGQTRISGLPGIEEDHIEEENPEKKVQEKYGSKVKLPEKQPEK